MNFFGKDLSSNNNDLNTHISGWKYAYACETGTSHLKFQTPRQDACLLKEETIKGVKYLFVAAADGAGSAKYSDRSSKYICKLFIKKTAIWLKENELTDLNRDTVLSWFTLFQKVMKRAAAIYRVNSTREFATTLLFSVLSDKGNIFIRVGDGVIAKGNDTEISCVFLPQNGEYLNTTFFATDKNVAELFAFEITTDKIERLIMHTDGIEIISFDFALKKPHLRFFNPFFAQLESSDNSGENKEVSEFISGFLNCDRVNQKTDDDKTMIIISAVKGGAVSDIREVTKEGDTKSDKKSKEASNSANEEQKCGLEEEIKSEGKESG